jgi:hypothetical protein
MDETLCRHFFLEPTQTYQKQYEALRAVFTEGRPLKHVAEQFGYEYGSLRTIASRFGAQLGAGQAPPSSPNRAGRPATQEVDEARDPDEPAVADRRLQLR